MGRRVRVRVGRDDPARVPPLTAAARVTQPIHTPACVPLRATTLRSAGGKGNEMQKGTKPKWELTEWGLLQIFVGGPHPH